MTSKVTLDFLKKVENAFPRRQWVITLEAMGSTTINCRNSSVTIQHDIDMDDKVLAVRVYCLGKYAGRGSWKSLVDTAFSTEARFRNEWSKRKTEIKRHITALHETELLMSSDVEISIPELVLEQGWIPKVELRFKGVPDVFAYIEYRRYELNCDRWETPYSVDFGGRNWLCKDWRAVIELFDSNAVFKYADNNTEASDLRVLEAYQVPDKEGREPRGLVILKRENLVDMAPYLLAMAVRNFHVDTVQMRVEPDWESIKRPEFGEPESQVGDVFLNLFQSELDSLLAVPLSERFVYADASPELAWDRSYTNFYEDAEEKYLDDLDDEDDFED